MKIFLTLLLLESDLVEWGTLLLLHSIPGLFCLSMAKMVAGRRNTHYEWNWKRGKAKIFPDQKQRGWILCPEFAALSEFFFCQFDILTDIVFDAMHLWSVNVVKPLASEAMNKREVALKLKQLQWSKDHRSLRLSISFESMGYWKAEEFQKLGFPASEFMFNNLLAGEE